MSCLTRDECIFYTSEGPRIKNWAGHSVSTWSHLIGKVPVFSLAPTPFRRCAAEGLQFSRGSVQPSVPLSTLSRPPSNPKRRPSEHNEKTISELSTRTCRVSIIYFHIRTFYIHKINSIFRYKVWLLVPVYLWTLAFAYFFAVVPKGGGGLKYSKRWTRGSSFLVTTPITHLVTTWGPTTSHIDGA